MTLIQRFGGALNLNVHLHMLWLDGVYDPNAARADKPRLHRVRAPTSAQLTELAFKIAHRVCRHLARKEQAAVELIDPLMVGADQPVGGAALELTDA